MRNGIKINNADDLNMFEEKERKPFVKPEETKAYSRMCEEYDEMQAEYFDMEVEMLAMQKKGRAKKKKIRKMRKKLTKAKIKLTIRSLELTYMKETLQLKASFEKQLLEQELYYRNQLMAFVAAVQYPEARKAWVDKCSQVTTDFVLTSCREVRHDE